MTSRKKKNSSEQNQNKLLEELAPEEFGYCFFEKRLKPKPMEELDQLGIEFIEYVEENQKLGEKMDSLTIRRFLNKKRICHDDWYRWIKRSPFLGKAHALVKSFIGDQKLWLAEKGICNAAAIMPYLHMYLDEYKKDIEWKAELRNKQDQQSNEPKIIVIEKFSDPKKIDEDKI